jgi:UDP-N-acetylglucosamine 2-epimerase (non-hydrolysing)
MDLQPHSVFVQLLNQAAFVMTDGGSIQEEVAYLGVPTLLLRHGSERPDGLGSNVVLSEMIEQKLISFLDEFESLRRHGGGTRESPSREIIDLLCSETGG